MRLHILLLKVTSKSLRNTTLFFLFFKYSRVGLSMRGVANDQDTAMLMGISVKWVFALTWGISFATLYALRTFGSLKLFGSRVALVSPIRRDVAF